MTRTRLLVLAAPLFAYLLALLLLFVVQRRLVFVPDATRPTAPAGFQEVVVPASDGLALLAWQRAGAPDGPVMLYLHGNGGNLDNRAARAGRFAGFGIGLLFLEWRGYGGNPGAPSEAGLMADARGAMAFLARQGYAPGRVILYGESLGTGIAVKIAAEQPVAAVILESPYTSLRDIAGGRMWWAPVGLLMRDPIDALAAMPAVSAPILVLRGARDDIVPPAMGQAMYDAARHPKQLWTAPSGGHADLMAHGLAERVVDFLGEQGLAAR
ncbi:MAG: alpha/beta hydrolase [Gemmatimonadaceae bacterium]|nr:alpha/beta hydrolase [Acetobacteraceae bacterium]